MSTGLLGLPWYPFCCLIIHHLFILFSSFSEKTSSSLPIRHSDAMPQKVEPPDDNQNTNDKFMLRFLRAHESSTRYWGRQNGPDSLQDSEIRFSNKLKTLNNEVSMSSDKTEYSLKYLKAVRNIILLDLDQSTQFTPELTLKSVFKFLYAHRFSIQGGSLNPNHVKSKQLLHRLSSCHSLPTTVIHGIHMGQVLLPKRCF